MNQTEFSTVVVKRLMKKYGDYSDELLHFENPTQMLIAAILSPQCTDKQVNATTEHLFKRFKAIGDYADVNLRALRSELNGINYYKTKARHVREAAKIVVERFNGKVPKTMGELMELPGVGRKVANVILTNGFGMNEGIAVDTHVITVASRLKLTRTRNPDRIEQDLLRKVPK
ncbi:MAG: endonuclease III, partial [Candidatus Micrarchaeota archaeon]|nr:endonuclease III [Candidatus Micrarchaeota archaeon]